MSETPGAPPDRDDEDEDDAEGARAMAALLKRSLSAEPVPRDGRVLAGVQRKLRQRSRGKFYGDGWSTTNTRTSYVLVALVMLLLMGVAYLALGPVGVAPR